MRSPVLFCLLGAVLSGACAPAAVGPRTAPRGTLPPVPARTGPIVIDVVYPAADQQVAVRDSTFIFGSVGTGDAQLRINGAPVEVAANGAFLAFLPVPTDGVYNLEVTARGETVRQPHRVRVPAASATVAPSEAPGVRIVDGSVSPSGVMTAVRGERIQVRVRGTPGAQATLVLPDGQRVPLTEQPVIDRQTGFMLDRAEVRTGVAEYVGSFPLTASIMGTDTVAPRLARVEGYVETPQRPARRAVVELTRGGQTATAPLTATIGMLEPGLPRVGIAATQRPDETVIGRKLPGPGNPYQWFFPNGTRFEVDGESGDFLRLRLAPDFHIWVEARDVQLLPPGTPAPRGEVSTIGTEVAGDYAAVTFTTTDRLPYHVEPHANGVAITFFGATGRTGFGNIGHSGTNIDRMRWQQIDDHRYRVEIETAEPLWGFLHGWNRAGNLELRLRRPPRIDPANPLRGLTIAVDAGHPPGGAIGPTRLTEADANLMVTRHLVAMLQRAGARVVDIRPDTTTVPLIQRPIMAIENDSHLFVSVHFNAFPDGVNPFANHGTMMLYYWNHSLGFARHLQREVLHELGLPDRGVRFQDLAIARASWMPSVLTESMYMMFPDQEAALRNPAVQERIARAHFRAMESFLREVAPLRR